MKEKILKTLLVILTIITLAPSNFLILGESIAEAVYEELENQPTALNSSIDYDAYFKVGDTKVHSMTASINQGTTLYININVKDTGVALDGGKIKLENANFKLGEVKNDFVKNINYETKEIELNQIAYGNNIEIELPIAFEKSESIDVGYFDAQNTITLSGTYKKNTSEKQITGSIKTALMWTEEADTNISQNIEKYMSLGENGVLLQNKLTVSVVNNVLPKQNEKITVNVPQIKNNKPEQVTIIKNGVKLAEGTNYNKETGILTIETSNNANEANKVIWNNGTDEYKIIYTYSKELGEEPQTITLDATIESRLYAKENVISKKDTQNVNISKIGNVASIEQHITESQYKGYMYANVDNETIYDETSIIEISDVNSLEKVEFSTVGDNFLDENGTQYNTQNSTYFKQTTINKAEMLRILGQDGTITIYKNGSEAIATLNKESQEDNNGNLVVTYEGNTNNTIKIVTSKPQQEGKLNIHNQKAIKGQTGYTKQQLKLVTGLESNVQVKGIDVGTAKAVMVLQDTITEAGINISTNNLSTLQENKNIQISIDLKTDSNKYDLYKNPTIQIKLPNDVESIQLNSEIQKLYGDEFTIESAKYNANNKTILLTFKGEQTTFGNSVNQGMHIVMDANITLNKLAPTKQDNIVMTYTNENGQEGSYEKSVGVNIVSKEGVLTYENISGYNESGENVETLSQDVATGKLDEGKSAKVVNANMAIVNNYNTEISDVVIIGKVPGEEERQINDTKLTSTFITSLAEGVTTNNEGAKIYYSEDIEAQEDSEMWKETVESFENVRAYKIVLNGSKIDSSGVINFGYKFNIPENLEKNQSTYVNYELTYTYAGQRVTTNSTVKLETEKKEVTPQRAMLKATNTEETQNIVGKTVEIANGITANIAATVGGEELKEGNNVNAGQTVKYTVTITNNSGSDISNVQMSAEHANAIFYGEEMRTLLTNDTDEEGNKIPEDFPFMILDNNLKTKELKTNKILNNESYKFQYEIQVSKKDNTNKLTGTIKIKADNIDEKEIETIENSITDGNLAVSLIKAQYTSYQFEVGYPNNLHLIVNNISSSDIKNQKVIMPLNNLIKIINVYKFDENNKTKDVEYTVENDCLVVNYPEIKAGEKDQVEIQFTIKEFENGNQYINFKTYAENNNSTYYSNEFSEFVNYYKSQISVEQKVDASGNVLKYGDKFNITLKITNNGDTGDTIEILNSIPEELKIESIYVTEDGERKEKEFSNTSTLLQIREFFKSNETKTYEFKFVVDKNIGKDIDLYFYVRGTNYSYKTDSFKFRIDKIGGDNSDEDDPKSDIIAGDNTEKEEIPDDEKEEKQNVNLSGKAWLDKNKDGKFDENDEALSGIKVYLLNSKTSKVENETNTNTDGTYKFDKIDDGEYLVAFEYDNTQYRVTVYKKNNVDNSNNSDVISKQININGQNKYVAVTDILQVKEKNISNINAGFIKNEKFDLKLDKYITKVTVQNDAGTTVQQYNNEKLAKVEIKSKNLANTLVLIEYTINVTNEGELPGYVGEILDYIPNDLKFSSEINKDWYLSTDRNLHNITLANEKIEVGQTKTVKLILTKTMTSSNTGLIINSAEIGKSNNELNITDIDSTPANKVDGEDDMSKAEVLVSVSTGKEIVIAISTILTVLIIIGVVIFIIKNRKEGEDE